MGKTRKKAPNANRIKANPINQTPPELAVFIGILIAIVLFFNHIQPRVTVNQGAGWDGRHYTQMAIQHLEGADKFSHIDPFAYRQLLPWLVATFYGKPHKNLTEQDVVDEKSHALYVEKVIHPVINLYHFLNTVFALLAAVLSLLLLRFFITNWKLRILLAVLPTLHYLGPIREVCFVPVTTHVFEHMAIVAVLVILQNIVADPLKNKKWHCCLAVVSFLAITNRFSVLPVIIIAQLFVTFTIWRRRSPDGSFLPHFLLAHIPIVAAIIGFVVVRANADIIAQFGEVADEESYWAYAFSLILKKSPLGYLHSVFIAWGPMLILLVWQWRLVGQFLKQHPHIAAVCLTFIGYSFIADTTPQLLMLLPIYVLLLSVVMEQTQHLLARKKITLALLLIGQAISQRLFWATPHDVPTFAPETYDGPLPWIFFTPLTDDYLIQLTSPEYTPRPDLELLFSGQYLAFTAVIFVMLLWRNKRDKPASQ